jgi:hypothetical protein
MSPVDLDAELLVAMSRARDPRIEPDFAAQGFTRALQWGVAHVEFYGLDRELYEPVENGRSMSFIVPVVEDGDLIDLAAIDGHTQHLATRHGFGRALGADAISKAAGNSCALVLVERPLTWLRQQELAVREVRRFLTAVHRVKNDPSLDTSPPREFAYLFNLADARTRLAEVEPIFCESEPLSDRVIAILPPSHRQRVLVVDQ